MRQTMFILQLNEDGLVGVLEQVNKQMEKANKVKVCEFMFGSFLWMKRKIY